MKKYIYQFIGFYLSFLLFSYSITIAQSNQEQILNQSIATTVLESNQKFLILEFNIPPFAIKKYIDQGREYQIIDVPGFGLIAEPGKPQLPVKGYLFGVPPDAEISFEILEANPVSFQNYDIYPVPQLTIEQKITPDNSFPDKVLDYWIDPEVYSTNKFFPSEIAQLGPPGFIRDQKVGRIQFYPIQYNPVTKEIKYFNRVKIKINFLGNNDFNPLRGTSHISPAFDELLNESLLNYPIAKSWQLKRMNTFQSGVASSETHFMQSGEWYKIWVVEDGIYIITKTALQNAGFNFAGIDPRKIKMFYRGKEIPIYISGEDDGMFDDADYIEFYGVKIHSEYTDTNVYWLTISVSNGLRMKQKDGSLNGSYPVLTNSKEKIHFEQNLKYETSIANAEGEDHWFWNYIIAPNKLDFNTELYSVSDLSANDCFIKMEFRGYSHTTVNPDHHTIISLNGYQLCDDKFDGQSKFFSTASFPQSYLKNGTNTITVNLPGDTGSSLDIVYVNWFEIEYWRDYIAQNDAQSFWGAGAGTHQFEVLNFSQNSLRLYDITDSTDVKRITGLTTEIDNRTGTYTLKFQDDLVSKHRYLAMTLDRRKYPSTVMKDEPSQLRTTTNQADYIFITHEDFSSTIVTLSDYRKQQGLETMIVNITDIYDEFSHGIKNPTAIKDYLSYAYHYWIQPAPTYVLLVGDASYDYKDYFGTGNIDYLPTHLFESQSYSTETSSDNWFACISGEDVLPDMFIGRLSVRTTAELEFIIDKIINYETNPPEGGWEKNTLWVADNGDAGGDFEGLSDYFIKNYIPSDFTTKKVYLRDFGSGAEPNSAIINSIDQGCLVTNYIGHGSMDTWASEKMFVSEDVARLRNGYKLPLLVTMSCINGFFQHPKETYSLAEEFLRAEQKGAIACFSPSGFGYTNADKILGDGLYSGLFQDDDQILGSVVTKSKLAIFATGNIYHDHIEFYNLLGDPALQLQLQPFTIHLTKDWNLISFPRQSVDSAVESILAPISDHWSQLLSFKNGKWYGAEAASDPSFWTLTEVKLGEGYWLQINEADQLPVTGIEKLVAIPLNQGWNLIGYPLIDSQPIDDAFSSINENWLKVNGFSDRNWTGADVSLSPVYWTLEELKPGCGYWLEMYLPDTLKISRMPTSSPPSLIAFNPSSDDESSHALVTSSTGETSGIVHQSPMKTNASTIPPIPCGFYGYLTINNKPAPVGTEIIAGINGDKYHTNFSVTKQGQYGLMYIDGDIIGTPQAEGGAPGDTVSFKIISMNHDSIRSSAVSIWESGVIHCVNLAINSMPSQDPPISLEFRVDDKIVGEEIFNGDPISRKSVISAFITGGKNGINENSIKLMLNGELIDKNLYQFIAESENAIPQGKIVYTPETLADGNYELTVEVSDWATQPDVLNATFSFIVSSSLRLEKVVNFPNPIQNDTKFTYHLINDNQAKVTIKIYTVAGRLIRVIDSAAGEIGYNETDWDGRDDYGDELANGVYFYKLIARDGSEKAEVIEKLVVMR